MRWARTRRADDNKARTQFAVRADVKDGDVYLDLGSPVFAKAASRRRRR